jgi:hypothetical protein
MRNQRRSQGAKPRGACPICHQHFADATDDEFKLRYTSHLDSLRHKRYLELKTIAPPQSRMIILKPKESIMARFERARNNPSAHS